MKFSGHNGTGNDGGPVAVYLGGSQPSIVTHAYGSHGVLAQSIGGGYHGRSPNSNGIVSDDATAGNGGAVTVQAQGSGASITTYGWGPKGIHAQAIGGGGGAWGNVDNFYNANPTQANAHARTSATGAGGAINFSFVGTISATGQNANAILAQSGKQITNGAIDPTSTAARSPSILATARACSSTAAARMSTLPIS